MIVLPIIEICNQGCRFCSAAGSPRYRFGEAGRREKTDLARLKKLIANAKDGVTISGGEPLLNPDLLKIIIWIKERNLFCELQSNGVLLSAPATASRLVRAKVDLFNINFPSHLEKKADEITQTKGFFKLRNRGIANLLQLGAAVRLTHIINQANYRDLPALIQYVKRWFPGIKFTQFSFVKIMGRAAQNRDFIPSYEAVAPFLAKALATAEKAKMDFIIDHIPMCFLGKFYERHIDYRKIISHSDLRFARQEKKQIKDCAKCRLRKNCSGVRKDYLELYKNKVRVRPIR